MRKLTIILLVFLVCQVAYAGKPSGNRMLFIWQTDRGKQVLENDASYLIWRAVNDAGDKDAVDCMTVSGERVFSLSLKKMNILQAKKEKGLVLNRLKEYLGQIKPSGKNTDIAGALQRAMEQVNMEEPKARTVIILLSSGLQSGKNIDLSNSYPSDSFASGGPGSPFSFIQENRTGQKLEVVMVPQPGDYVNTFHRDRIQRFYAILFQKRNASLAGFSEDHKLISEVMMKGTRTPIPVARAENPGGPLILYRVEEKQQYREEAGNEASSVNTVSSPRLFVTVLKLGVEKGMAQLWVSCMDPQGSPVGDLKPGNFRIYETYRGRRRLIPTRDIRLQGQSEKKPLAAVLLRDTSPSQTRDDLKASENAIRLFVDRLAYDDVAAVVEFSGDIQTTHDFSGDKEALKSSMGLPMMRSGTSLYDALIYAVNMLGGKDGYLGTVVGFTDGEDTTSNAKVADVKKAAKAASIPLFLVGTGDADGEILNMLASDSGGMYLPAPDAGALATIYENLSGILGRSVMLSYPTLAKAGEFQVDVTIE